MLGWKKVKDTRLARKMFSDFRESEESGYIMIFNGVTWEDLVPHIVEYIKNK